MKQSEADMLGRGVAFPPRISQGRLVWSSGAANVRESIRVTLLTEPRERVMEPQFGGGLKRFLFQPNTAATHKLIEEVITQALGRWEPRIRVESVVVEADPDDRRAAQATVDYRLVATQASAQLELRLVLNG